MIEITDRSSWGHRVALWSVVVLFGGLIGLVLFYWP